MNANANPVTATPTPAPPSKPRKAARRPPRSSRAAAKAEKLVCRYCGSDDLAPSFKVPLDHCCRLDQHHQLQTAWPQSVEQDPEQTVEGKQPEPTRPLAAKNAQLMTEGQIL